MQSLCKLGPTLLLCVVPVFGSSIANIAVMNNSTASSFVDEPTRIREFRTQAFTPASATQNGNSVTFTNRMAWVTAQRVLPPSDLPMTHGGRVAYDLMFTVEDPLSLGYDLSIDSDFRGVLTAAFESNLGVFPSLVFASGTLMAASIDSGSGFGPLLNDISTTTDVVMADPANPFVNQIVSKSGSYDVGTFVGTRTFTLRFSNVAGNTSASLQNYNTGEADVRFGLGAASPRFLYGSYPGTDGESADTHGHFVTVTASFNDGGTSVPEPGTMGMLLGGGLLSLALKRRSDR